MCGIVGVFKAAGSSLSSQDHRKLFEEILKLSQSRGVDSAGVGRFSGTQLTIYKDACSAARLLKSSAYRQMVAQELESFGLIGHARMETNGSIQEAENNQPVISDGVMVIHNGIIVNDAEVWANHPEMTREFEVDTEVINALVARFQAQGMNLVEALQRSLVELKGAYSVAVYSERQDTLALASNTGSLYFGVAPDQRGFVFASEERFLSPASKKGFVLGHLASGQGLALQLVDLSFKVFDLIPKVDRSSPSGAHHESDIPGRKIHVLPSVSQPTRDEVRQGQIIAKNGSQLRDALKMISQEYERVRERVRRFRRCSKCILPETMPFIRFDENGVCNYCHNHVPRKVLGPQELEKAIAPIREIRGRPNCILSFSGGRDSSYALHYVKKELGLNPVAFSYDWGMLTDLGRRNQARMTGSLGVEHILVSADIHKKRRFIRKNVEAWLRKPDIGMIPLFMAGDKQYFYHLNRLRGAMGIDDLIYAENSLEKTDFKYGFAGVYNNPDEKKAYDIGKANTLRLLGYYGSRYLSNPGYINESLLDTGTAYFSSYFVPKGHYCYLFKYILWDEREIESVLLGQYDWEVATDTKSTWRIGDGTAAFYNYIYFTLCGFTENDTFRSNQIREGVISRDEAILLAERGNQPRMDSILWYLNTVGIELLPAIERINGAKKLYTELAEG